MNELTKFLIQELLDEQKTVAIYGGGFKPPTKGHFTVVEKALSDFPEIDEFKVFVGSGVRDGVTQEESIKVWDIYKNYLSPKVNIEPSVAPVKSILGYAKENPETKVYWILGAREGNEEDVKDIINRTKTIDKYPNIEVKTITTTGGVSGTKTRDAIKSGNKELFYNSIPDIKEKDQIWDLVSPVIKEVGEANLTPYKWEEVDRESQFIYVQFTTNKGNEYKVDLEFMEFDNPKDEDMVLDAMGIEFMVKREGEQGYSSKVITNEGDALKIMSTIVNIIKYYVKKYKIQAILYSPSKKQGEDFGTQRDQLYKAFIKKAFPGVYFEQKGDWVAAILPKTFNEANNPQAGTALPYGSGFAPVKEIVTDTEVICDNCGWEWNIKDGGEDLYVCHKCGHDNNPKENLNKAWNLQEGMLSLSKYMIDNGMNIKPLPKIKVIKSDKQNASDLLGKTAFYNPNDKSITLYTMDRHPKDILRSFAHEMIHHEQNLNGKLENITTTNTNEGGDLPEIEREAYEKGNMMLRNWEDSIKNPINEWILDIPKFNQPKTFIDKLNESLNELTLSKDNAVKINGDLMGGEFNVGNKIYEYSIKNIPNPYKDLGLFYNIQFTPQENITSTPTKDTDPKDYIKILSTMYKIIVDFVEKEKPDYIGIASLDNIGDKNYHRIYANLTDNKYNRIPGYFRKDASLEFDSPAGKGRFVVLKRKNV